MARKNKAGFTVTQVALLNEAHMSTIKRAYVVQTDGHQASRRLKAASDLVAMGVFTHDPVVSVNRAMTPKTKNYRGFITTYKFTLTPEWVAKLDAEDIALEALDYPSLRNEKSKAEAETNTQRMAIWEFNASKTGSNT